MANMIFLKSELGSKVVYVACPECSRISKQVLMFEYNNEKNANFSKVHKCLTCKNSYLGYSKAQTNKWQSIIDQTVNAINSDLKISAYNSNAELAYSSEKDAFKLATNQKVNKKNDSIVYESAKTISESNADQIVSLDSSDDINEKSKLRKNDNKSEETKTGFEAQFDRKVEEWKSKLLDTSRRNKLINYSDGRNTLRIMEPSIADLFNRLSRDEELVFQTPIDRTTDYKTWEIITLFKALSYDLDFSVGDIKVNYTPAVRDRILKNLKKNAKLSLEEQGTNSLYISFGFIEWREPNLYGSETVKSPVLLMPITINKPALNAPYSIIKYDGEVEVNPTLDHIFELHYDFNLPAFDAKNESSINEYLSAVGEIVDKQGWRLIKEASIGILSFNKISMYNDLSNNRELLINNPVIRAIAGDPSRLEAVPEKYVNYDYDKEHPSAWHQVVNSDSSQQEAIMLSKAGISFVMEGPPGTGKSQTITNIIAEGLADGKKILFVSEKSAALQVVLKRLTEVGLDDFCLPLHNHKANKKDIIDNIGRNLSLTVEKGNSADDIDLTTLFNNREYLNKYAHDLHEEIMPLESSIYEAFGILSNLDNASKLKFALSDIGNISKNNYIDMLSKVRNHEKALKDLNCKLSEHPWYKTTVKSSNQTFKQEFEDETKGFNEQLNKLETNINQFCNDYQLPFDGTWKMAQNLEELLKDFIKLPLFLPKLSNTEICDVFIDTALNAKQLRGKANSNRAEAEKIFKEAAFSFDAKNWLDSINNSIEDAKKLTTFKGKNSETIIRECDNYYNDLISLRDNISSLLFDYKRVANLLQIDEEASLTEAEKILDICHTILKEAFIRKDWFDNAERNSSLDLIAEVKQHLAEYNVQKEVILKDWELSAIELPAEEMLFRFKTEYTGLLKSMKTNYKADMKLIKAASRTVGARIEDVTAIDLLQKVKDLNQAKKWFSANQERLVRAFAPYYNGITSDWIRIEEGLQYVSELKSKYLHGVVPQAVIDLVCNRIDNSADFVNIAHYVNAHNKQEIDYYLNKLIDFSYSNEIAIEPLNDVLADIEKVIESANIINKKVDEFKPNVQVEEDKHLFIEYADMLISLKQTRADLEQNGEKYAEVFDRLYNGIDTDWDRIIEDTTCVKQFYDKYPEIISFTYFISSTANDSNQRAKISEYHKKIKEQIEQCGGKISWFCHLFETGALSDKLCDLVEKHSICSRSFNELDKWIDYAETKHACDKIGLDSFTDAIAINDNTIEDVLDAFNFGFYKQWIDFALNKEINVKSFRKRVQEENLKSFKELDKKQLTIARPRIRRNVIKNFPDTNRIMSARDELYILQHEMGKKRAIMPIRRLFSRIPNLLLTLKPCLMMSPLSVAYFLDASKYQFDMIIFDEASQIFPQDAIGAISRGKQVVITGDTNQLPPTNFFNSSGSNITDDPDEYVEDEVFESILEEASSVLPNRTLAWHYRSKHEHLIAFSNQEIYDSKLVTFPSSVENEENLGVEFVFVEDGYYESGGKNHNINEAKKCVELVKEHIDKHPERSLGIIAFGAKQQDTIIREIERFRENNPKYEHFFLEEKEEEFFVKNLENVQGDERDTIILSVCYAQTAYEKRIGKPMAMRFGPLGNTGGERRLNVAITRAKKNIKLVSSIKPSDIDLNRTNSTAIKMLRSYIEFAMKGSIALRTGNEQMKNDDFVDRIARFIESNGYLVSKYVGCSGYKVDIAIKHPTIEGRYIAGIECDGMSYISAKTARDRDLLRVSVLDSMGWKMHRVWSTEWYQNPDSEGKRLMDFIKECEEHYLKIQEEEKREQERIAEKKRLEEKRVAEAKKLEEERLEKARLEAEKKRLEQERLAEERKRQEEAKLAERKRIYEEQQAKRREEERRLREKEKQKQAAEKRRKEQERLVEESKHLQSAAILAEQKRIFEEQQAKIKGAQKQNEILNIEIGDVVGHKIFKEGLVVELTDDIIRIEFDDNNVKKFKYPHAFQQGFIWKL